MFYNFISLSGIFALGIFAWFFSVNRKNINWHLIFWGIFIQLLFAFIIFKLPAGILLFEWLNAVIIKLLSFSKYGIQFLFGPLGLSPGESGPNGEKSLGFILAIQALPAIIFFSAFISLLYYLRIMQFMVGVFARIFTKLMRLSGAESLCASSNIFVGVESALVVRPYLKGMTMSELHTVLTACMATIASSVLSVYVMMLKGDFAMIAGHLISASILSAPAALVISKLVYPEDGKPLTFGHTAKGYYAPASNWIEAIINGANDAVKLCVGIAALLIAFISLLYLFNWIISSIGNPIVEFFGLNFDISLENILGYLFYPFTFMIGVPIKDLSIVSKLLGERLILTELVSYQHLAGLISNGTITDSRSVVLASYALCGFSHIASLAIFIGGISALIPERTRDLTKLGFRALFSATLACLMTAAVAGVFYIQGQAILFRN